MGDALALDFCLQYLDARQIGVQIRPFDAGSFRSFEFVLQPGDHLLRRQVRQKDTPGRGVQQWECAAKADRRRRQIRPSLQSDDRRAVVAPHGKKRGLSCRRSQFLKFIRRADDEIVPANGRHSQFRRFSTEIISAGPRLLHGEAGVNEACQVSVHLARRHSRFARDIRQRRRTVERPQNPQNRKRCVERLDAAPGRPAAVFIDVFRRRMFHFNPAIP